MIPVVQRYTAVVRHHTYRGLRVTVCPGVFHPGLFGSTHFLIDYLRSLPLVPGFRCLELGAGTGLISLSMLRRGGRITASDISPLAIANLHENFGCENVRIVQSDLFENLTEEHYDLIVINPPYYPHDPKAPEEYAWFCGQDFEYFRRLFAGISAYMHGQTACVIVLSAACNIEFIHQLALQHGLALQACASRFRLLERRDFIFQIVRRSTRIISG